MNKGSAGCKNISKESVSVAGIRGVVFSLYKFPPSTIDGAPMPDAEIPMTCPAIMLLMIVGE
jgi:hypothetical protein